jgi:hypothetical protein
MPDQSRHRPAPVEAGGKIVKRPVSLFMKGPNAPANQISTCAPNDCRDLPCDKRSLVGETKQHVTGHLTSRRREVVLRDILDILLEYEIGYFRERWNEDLASLYGELDVTVRLLRPCPAE